MMFGFASRQSRNEEAEPTDTTARAVDNSCLMAMRNSPISQCRKKYPSRIDSEASDGLSERLFA